MITAHFFIQYSLFIIPYLHPSPPNKLPNPPHTLPSSLLEVVAYYKIRPAKRLMGKVCIQTAPGPRRVAKNNPSPPKMVFLISPIN